MPKMNPGRVDLARWLEGKPCNLYDVTPNLARLVRLHAGAERFAVMERCNSTASCSCVQPAALLNARNATPNGAAKFSSPSDRPHAKPRPSTPSTSRPTS